MDSIFYDLCDEVKRREGWLEISRWIYEKYFKHKCNDNRTWYRELMHSQIYSLKGKPMRVDHDGLTLSVCDHLEEGDYNVRFGYHN